MTRKMKTQRVPYRTFSAPYATATGLYSAHLLPWAPGTVGSIAAAIVGLILFPFGGTSLLLAGSVLWFFAGWWAIHRIERTVDDAYHDAGVFVADEWCGQWLVLATALHLWNELPLWQAACAALLAFRFFDIVKPWPVKWIDRKMHSALGVMLDDVVAAIMGCGALVTLDFLMR